MNTQTFTPSPAPDRAKTGAFEDSPERSAQILLAWTAPTHHNHERSPRWYLIAGIVVILIAAYGILTGAWTVALVTLLLAGVYFLTRREPMPLKDIRIELDGVQFEDTFTPWKQCKEFWLVRTPLFTELRITRMSGRKREIRIQTGEIDPVVIRSTVSQFVPMRADQREHLLDVFLRLCKL